MDWPDSSLLSKQLYCTQELVNLIISGRAISNLHDGEIDLAGQKLKGLTEPQDIGQLSLFEYYDNLKVGSFGKNPIYPIWVVCCESHYSVVFSPIKPIEEKTFDLLYYDGLLKPTKEILLSITQADYKPKETRELTPLLELVLGTKFDNVLVDWNGTEPIL